MTSTKELLEVRISIWASIRLRRIYAVRLTIFGYTATLVDES